MSKSKFDFLIFIQIIAFEHFLSVILLLITKCLIPLIPLIDKADHYYTGFHYLEQLPSTEKKKWPTKPCRVCSKEKRRETPYFCPVCDVKPALCVNDCFKKYHS